MFWAIIGVVSILAIWIVGSLFGSDIFNWFLNKWLWWSACNLKRMRKARHREMLRAAKRKKVKELGDFLEKVHYTARQLKSDGRHETSDGDVAAWFEQRGYEVIKYAARGGYWSIRIPPITDKELSDIMMK